MVGLALLILVEKLWTRGPLAGRVAGLAALGLAVALIWVPGLAPGLDPGTMGHVAPMRM
jgi:hypothetical protein